jgi:hypothetical protein
MIKINGEALAARLGQRDAGTVPISQSLVEDPTD